MLLAFTKRLLMGKTTCAERVCHLQLHSMVVAAYITLQTI